jgi:hypothetical protein
MPPIKGRKPKEDELQGKNNHWIAGYTSFHKPQRVPLLDKKILKKTKTLLRKVETTPPAHGVDGPGAPGGHIARVVTQIHSESRDKSSEHTLLLRQESKPYQFTEDVNSMISFGHYDINSRPKWEERFREYPKEIAAKELEKRMKQRSEEKMLASSDSAIMVIMRDILDMYTTKFQPPKTQTGRFQSPDNLNLDETHVWLRLRIGLYKAGEAITHRQLEVLASLCRQYRAASCQPNASSSSATTASSISFERKQPKVKIPSVLVHFMRYLNLILGGSHSFRSAQFMLLRDLTYLLKLIQNVRVLLFLFCLSDSLLDHTTDWSSEASPWQLEEGHHLSHQRPQKIINPITATASIIDQYRGCSEPYLLCH